MIDSMVLNKRADFEFWDQELHTLNSINIHSKTTNANTIKLRIYIKHDI